MRDDGAMLGVVAAIGFLIGFGVGLWVHGEEAEDSACVEACLPLSMTRESGRCRCIYPMEPRGDR